MSWPLHAGYLVVGSTEVLMIKWIIAHVRNLRDLQREVIALHLRVIEAEQLVDELAANKSGAANASR